VEDRKLTLVKRRGEVRAAGREVRSRRARTAGEMGRRKRWGRVGASGLVETLMVEGSIVTSGSFGSEIRDLFLECCSLQI
jgi:hypothetical protein